MEQANLSSTFSFICWSHLYLGTIFPVDRIILDRFLGSGGVRFIFWKSKWTPATVFPRFSDFNSGYIEAMCSELFSLQMRVYQNFIISNYLFCIDYIVSVECQKNRKNFPQISQSCYSSYALPLQWKKTENFFIIWNL